MGSCLPWLLFISFLVLGVSGGFASLWAYFYFPSGEDPSLEPPINQTEASSARWNNDRQVTPEFKKYVEATRESSNYFEDSRLYVILPGGLNALASLVLALACLFSRKIFSSTAVIYTALSLWAVNLSVTIWFQNSGVSMLHKYHDFRETFMVILGIHVGQLLLLTIQILMAGIEVRRQKVAWPTINFKNILTFSTPLLTARAVLPVYAIIVFCQSLLRGMFHRILDDDFGIWDNPRGRFPDYYVFPCAVILMYGAIVSFEGLLSLLLGKVHTRLMGVTSLISGIMYCFIALISSPSMMFIISGLENYFNDLALMGLSLGSGLLSILHGILCLASPKRMVSPPKIVENLLAFAYEGVKISGSSIKRGSLSLLHDGTFSIANKNMKKVSGKAMLAAFSVITLILASIGIDNEPVSPWKSIIIVAGDVAILSRILPSFVSEFYTKQEETTTGFKMFLHFMIEGVLNLVGVIACFTCWGTALIIAGIMKLLNLLILVKTSFTLSEVKAALAEIGKDGQQNQSRSELLQNDELQTAAESENEDASLPTV